MNTDFTVRMVFLNTNCTNLTNIFWHTNESGFYRADGIFEHELHEFNEYFLAHE